MEPIIGMAYSGFFNYMLNGAIALGSTSVNKKLPNFNHVAIASWSAGAGSALAYFVNEKIENNVTKIVVKYAAPFFAALLITPLVTRGRCSFGTSAFYGLGGILGVKVF